MKILLIEDNPPARRLLMMQLRSYGYDVTACIDAETGLAAYQETFHPLIVADLGLPGMDGLEFCRHIRKLPQGDRSVILVITVYDAFEMLQAVLDAGADDYLTKPVNADQLQVRLTILERQFRDLVQHKWAEEALRESEQQFRSLFETMAEGVAIHKVVYDEKGIPIDYVILDVNPAYQSHTGIVRESAVGKKASDLYGTGEPPYLDIVEPVAATGKSNQFEFYFEPMQKHFIAHLCSPEKGLFAAIFEDITERKRTEEGLRQLEKAVETMQVGVTISTPEGQILYTNPTEARMHGYMVEDLRGKDIGILAPSERREPLTLDQIRTLPHRTRESVNVRKDGSTFPVQLISDVVSDAQGEPMAIVTICEDITQRKQADQALQASARQYRLLAESVADGIGIIQDGKCVFVNNALATMLGHLTEQLIGSNPEDMFCHEYKTHFISMCERTEQNLSQPPQQPVCVTRNNRKIWIEDQYDRITWEGHPAIILTMRDITERKLHEITLEEEKEHLKKINFVLRSTMKERYRFGDFIGKSAEMQKIYELIANAAASDANVVISGESGTGKELVAWTIHYLSTRKDKVFVPVNCGAVTESLFESEFFGHRKGAFTGAHKDKGGFFDHAHGGTLFLDEVGELSLPMQVKLLRALAGSGHTAVGDHTVRKADVRIISATNRHLANMVKQGTMREDFFFRIHVIPITVPPLRERREDIPLLIEHFLEQYSGGKQKLTLPGSLIEQLYRYDWPGNVRELQNVLERYLTTKRLDFHDLGVPGSNEPQFVVQRHISDAKLTQEESTLTETMDQFEKHVIAKALEQNFGHRGKTATMLGITRRSLNRKMNKYHIT